MINKFYLSQYEHGLITLKRHLGRFTFTKMMCQYFLGLLSVCARIYMAKTEGILIKRNQTKPLNETESKEACNDMDVLSATHIYQMALTLGMEQLWMQLSHINAIQKRCDFLQCNGIELKKLPQILFHASAFLKKEAKIIEEKLKKDFEKEELKTEPFSQSLITQIKNFLVEIDKFIGEQKTLTEDEVKKMKYEVDIAEKELEVASDSIAEKVMQIKMFLGPKNENKNVTYINLDLLRK